MAPTGCERRPGPALLRVRLQPPRRGADPAQVEWVRDRRGHGLLRLRLARRVERRATWLDRQLRARRRKAWRSHRRLWASLLACYGLLMVGLAVLEPGHPVARAAMLGAVGTAAAGTLIFGLVLVDGTLLARLGRMTEEAVGDELRGTPGVYGVVSNLPFACSDVDHVVLAPAGVLAVSNRSTGCAAGSPRPAGPACSSRPGPAPGAPPRCCTSTGWTCRRGRCSSSRALAPPSCPAGGG